MSNIKRYVVDFTYQDNNQIFGSGGLLTEEEKTRIEDLLSRYNKAGAIDSQSVHEPIEVDHDFDKLVDEIRTALENEVTDGDDKSQCQNCDRVWPDAVIVPLEEVKKLFERVTPGEPMPSGECPVCGALCQPVSE
jgi:hypothetical protein